MPSLSRAGYRDVWDDLVSRVGVEVAQQVRDLYFTGLRHATLERLADRFPDMTLGELTQLVRELQRVGRTIRMRQSREERFDRAMEGVLRDIRRR